MNRTQIQLFAAAAALLMGAAGCHRRGGSSGADSEDAPVAMEPVAVEMATVLRRPMEETVDAQGTLSPAQGAVAHVTAVNAGRIASITVREGQRVEAGQVVATIDLRPQQAQARSALAALTAAQATAREAELAASAAATDQANAVRLARLALESARIDRGNAVRQAQLGLDAANTDLRKTRAGARPQEIAQADQAVRQAQVTRDRAATEAERQSTLLRQGIAARRAVEDAQTALQVAEAGLETAKQQDSLVRAGARPEDLRAAEVRVQQARATLGDAQRSGDAKVLQAQASLRQAEQSVLQVAAKRQDARAQQDAARQKLADLQAAQAVAGYADVRAPMSGIVTKRLLNAGDPADTTNPIVEIANTRALNLSANLPAEDGMKVRPGMPVRVASPDVPGATFGGEVLSVGQVDPQTNLMSVRIAVDNHAGTLRAGTFATAQIIIHTDAHAVVAPRQAVVSRDGKSVVFTVDKGIAHLTNVQTGVQEGDYVEIVKGVAPGDKVIKLGQYSLDDGAKVKPAEPASAESEGGGGGDHESAGAGGGHESTAAAGGAAGAGSSAE